MKHHTKKGTPMSLPLSILLDKAAKRGHELKSLVHGVRIMGTDVVASDTWTGLYLCKSGARGFGREELGVAKLMPADKGCWRVCVERSATEPEEAAKQAQDMLALAVKIGYLTTMAEEVAVVEAKAEEAPAPEPVEEVVVAPKEGGRRKKGKVKLTVEDALSAAIEEL